MHRNTNLLIISLALVATLLFGIKVKIWLRGGPAEIALTTPVPTPVVFTTYTNMDCGVSLNYPVDFTREEATNAARLTSTISKESIDIACAKTVPKPPLPKEKISETTVASISATVYHDASAKDGSPRDVVVFTHPKKQLEVAVFGFGEVFQNILSSLKLL